MRLQAFPTLCARVTPTGFLEQTFINCLTTLDQTRRLPLESMNDVWHVITKYYFRHVQDPSACSSVYFFALPKLHVQSTSQAHLDALRGGHVLVRIPFHHVEKGADRLWMPSIILFCPKRQSSVTFDRFRA